jgi:hypothetical protein
VFGKHMEIGSGGNQALHGRKWQECRIEGYAECVFILGDHLKYRRGRSS